MSRNVRSPAVVQEIRAPTHQEDCRAEKNRGHDDEHEAATKGH